MDLLISYSWGQFYRAKPEAIHILKSFGDADPTVVKAPVQGIAIAHTSLDNREVIRLCRALWQAQPKDSFVYTIKWVPVDHWCLTDLEEMKSLIDRQCSSQIGSGQTWGMVVHKRRWQKYHTQEIVEYLAADIERKVDLGKPDLLLWVDILGRKTAISLLRPEDIFSIGRSFP